MGDASYLLRSSVLLLLVLAIDVPLLAMAGPLYAQVRLRIEGKYKTIFEGDILTYGHSVTTASGGTHHCDGTNRGAHKDPGPTATTALDDAARLNQTFNWDGGFDGGYDDYFITRIGDSVQTKTEYWGIFVGYQHLNIGGCQAQMQSGNDVLFAFDAFNADHLLMLSGPSAVVKNNPFELTVIDGKTGNPVAGAVVSGYATDANGQVTRAVVNGYTTDANGQVTINAGNIAGAYTLKATRPSSIRSNLYTLVVTETDV